MRKGRFKKNIRDQHRDILHRSERAKEMDFRRHKDVRYKKRK